MRTSRLRWTMTGGTGDGAESEGEAVFEVREGGGARREGGGV